MRLKLKRTTWMWTALAVAGLVIAVGVSYAAGQLAKPSVGLTNEPVSAGARLTPAATPAGKAKPAAKPKRQRPRPQPQPTVAAPPPVTPTAPAPAPAPEPSAPVAPTGTQTAPHHHDDSSGSDDSSHHGSEHDD